MSNPNSTLQDTAAFLRTTGKSGPPESQLDLLLATHSTEGKYPLDLGTLQLEETARDVISEALSTRIGEYADTVDAGDYSLTTYGSMSDGSDAIGYIRADESPGVERFESCFRESSIPETRYGAMDDPAFHAFRISDPGGRLFVGIQTCEPGQCDQVDAMTTLVADGDGPYRTAAGPTVTLPDRLDAFYAGGLLYVVSRPRFEWAFGLSDRAFDPVSAPGSGRTSNGAGTPVDPAPVRPTDNGNGGLLRGGDDGVSTDAGPDSVENSQMSNTSDRQASGPDATRPEAGNGSGDAQSDGDVGIARGNSAEDGETPDTASRADGDKATTVLLVEDEEKLLDIYATYLEELYEVKTATGGDVALETIDDTVDVVLLDRRMPGRSGDEVLEAIRDAGYDCPVAMVTAVEPDFDIVDMGFEDYLIKPVSKRDLIQTVETLRGLSPSTDLQMELSSLLVRRNVLRAEKDEAELEESAQFTRLESQIEAIRSRLNAPDHGPDAAR